MLGASDMFRHPAWPQKWPEMHVEQRNSIAYRAALVAAGEFDAMLVMNWKKNKSIQVLESKMDGGGVAFLEDAKRKERERQLEEEAVKRYRSKALEGATGSRHCRASSAGRARLRRLPSHRLQASKIGRR